MPRLHRSMFIPLPPQLLFDVVAGIDRYPEFIRWIRTMEVSDRRENGGVRHCVGRAEVGFKGFTEMFATTVAADAEALEVRIGLVEGPLRELDGVWRFRPRAGGTDLELDIRYAFSNFVLAALARANQSLASRRITDSFIAEAERRAASAGVAPTPTPPVAQ